MPLVNDPIMSGRSIRPFRHLECQNPSFISDFVGIPNGGHKIGKISEEEQEQEESAESNSYRRG